MCFYTIDVGPLLGNDVDHGSERHAAIERRSRTTEYFYLTNLVERDAEVGCGNVSGKAIQSVAIEHDKDFLLSVAVDATHGDVDVIVAVDNAHAGHVGGKHFL